MSTRVSCPFCNTAFALDSLPADRRAVCPRCGDGFAIRGEVDDFAGPPGGTATAPASLPAAPIKSHRRFSLSRLVAFGVILGLIGFAAGKLFSPKRDDPTP